MLLKKFDFTPILGWSVSRYDTFKTCRRRYYYTYYAKFDPEFSADRINRLKQMTNHTAGSWQYCARHH